MDKSLGDIVLVVLILKQTAMFQTQLWNPFCSNKIKKKFIK